MKTYTKESVTALKTAIFERLTSEFVRGRIEKLISAGEIDKAINQATLYEYMPRIWYMAYTKILVEDIHTREKKAIQDAYDTGFYDAQHNRKMNDYYTESVVGFNPLTESMRAAYLTGYYGAVEN